MTLLDSCRLADRLTLHIEAEGLEVRQNEDFADFERSNRAIGRQPPARVFDPESRPDGFWLGLYDSGELCGFHALALLPPAKPDLATLFETVGPVLMPWHLPVDPRRSMLESEALRRLSGSIAYHGEGWVAPAYRGCGRAGQLSRLLNLLGWIRWRPDAIFAFTIPETSNRRFARALCYDNFEPEGMYWCDREGGPVTVEGLMWNDRASLERWSRRPVTPERVSERGSGERQRLLAARGAGEEG